MSAEFYCTLLIHLIDTRLNVLLCHNNYSVIINIYVIYLVCS